MTTPRIVSDPNENRVHYSFDGFIAVALYDLMFHDSNDVKPASSQSDAGAEALNQRTFAQSFAGAAGAAKLSTDAADVHFPVLTDIVADIDCASSAWEVGDFVAIAEAASGIALENQKVVKTTDPSLAIGRCLKREASAVTTVRARLTGKLTPSQPASQGALLNRSGSNVETLSAAKTLAAGDAPIQVLDPGGAGRDIVLPAESLGLSFFIHNGADAAEVLTIKASDASTVVCTPTQNETAVVYSDGTSWRGIVGSNN